MTSQSREIKFNETTVTGRCTPKTTKKAHNYISVRKNVKNKLKIYVLELSKTTLPDRFHSLFTNIVKYTVR